MQRLARRLPGTDGVDPELLAELEREPRWMYPWELAPGMVAPVIHPWLPRIHETRLAMMDHAVRWALAEGGEEPSVLDLACNEGWFSHRMLEMGARRVLGLDIREVNIRRARLLAAELGIDGQLELRRADVFDLDPAEPGQFDVVLLLGLIYHVEDPVGAVRRARACTRTLCVIETQLTRQEEPIEWGMGREERRRQPGSFAVYPETDSSENPLASAEGVLSLVPNRAAVEEMARAAGFGRIEMVAPPPLAHDVYIEGDRGLFLCWA